jgi:type IV fimbrial biogenesis protein FimT
MPASSKETQMKPFSKKQPVYGASFGFCLAYSQRGLSLIELLVTASILMIFGSLAAPALSTFTQASQLSGIQSEFMASLALARNEASKRNVPVYVQAIQPVTGNAFGGGWMVWADNNKNGVLDSTEPTIKTHAALPSTVIFGDGAVTGIPFSAKGYLSLGAVVQLNLCQSGTNTKGYRITIQYNGLSDVSANISCT